MDKKEKKLELKVQPQLNINSPSNPVALDTQDTSILDLCIIEIPLKTVPGNNRIRRIVLYIHPEDKELGELTTGENQVSYMFRGLEASTLKVMTELEFQKVGISPPTESEEDIFTGHYAPGLKIAIYNIAEHIHTRWYKKNR